MENKTNASEVARVELESLVGIFYQDVADLGQFAVVEADAVPDPQRSLLNHDRHMTVTVEKFHSSPVEVRVSQVESHNNHYAREILLTRTSDGSVVQYGIVRLNFDFFSEQVRQEITGRQTPLGRILINHNVMRRVQLLSLYRIHPGRILRQAFELSEDEISFGRTALIYCDDQPAVELLEIVAV